MRFKRLLAYTPQSEKTDPFLETVFDVARTSGAEIKFLDVFEDIPEEIVRFVTPMHLDNMKELTERERRLQLETIADRVVPEVNASVDFFWGKPAVEIVRTALRDNHDLIVTPIETGACGVGVTAMQLVRKSATPVWAMHRDNSRPRRVLAAVDPFVYGQTRNELNLRILDTAQSICSLFGSDLHVLHVWQMFSERGFTAPPASGELDRFLADTRDRHRTALDGLLAETACTVPRDRAHLREGEPARTIVDFVKSQAIDLLIMGGLHSLELPGHFVGGTAEKILHWIPCSVLCIKPSDFVSPIKVVTKSLAEPS